MHELIKSAMDAATKTAAEDATKKTDAVKAVAVDAENKAAATPSRIRTKRLPVPAVPLALSVVVPIVWDTPFPTANYTMPAPGIEGTGLITRVFITPGSRTKTGCSLSVTTTAILGGNVATLHVLAIHDPS